MASSDSKSVVASPSPSRGDPILCADETTPRIDDATAGMEDFTARLTPDCEADMIVNQFFNAPLTSDCEAAMEDFVASHPVTRSANAGEQLWNVLEKFVGSADLTVERALNMRKLLRAVQVGDKGRLLEHMQLLWAEVWIGLVEFTRPSDTREAKRRRFIAEAEMIVLSFFAARKQTEAKAPSKAL